MVRQVRLHLGTTLNRLQIMNLNDDCLIQICGLCDFSFNFMRIKTKKGNLQPKSLPIKEIMNAG